MPRATNTRPTKRLMNRSITTEMGAPLKTLDGELVTKLEVGLEVLAPTIFGWMKGCVRKRFGWDVEGKTIVAFVEWCEKRNCFVSSGAYHKSAAEELKVRE